MERCPERLISPNIEQAQIMRAMNELSTELVKWLSS